MRSPKTDQKKSSRFNNTAIHKQFTDVINYCKLQVVGRDDVFNLAALSILSNNHLLMMGDPGVAKSMIANTLFKCFTGAETFKIKCTGRMSEEYLVGPLDMRLFRDTGEYVHMVDGTLVTADFAFLDEFLDLPDQAARAVLSILNEREFIRGRQHVSCKLRTAIAATNFTPDTKELQAVQDRFLFRTMVKPLANVTDINTMLKICNPYTDEESNAKEVVPPTMAYSDLAQTRRRIATVIVHPTVMNSLATFGLNARTERLPVTDRRLVWALNALKANAWLNNRDYVNMGDLMILESVFGVAGNDTHMSQFSMCVKQTFTTRDFEKDDKSLEVITQVGDQIDDLISYVEMALDQGKPLKDCKEEAKDIVSALMSDTSLTDIVKPIVDKYVAQLNHVINTINKK